MSTDPPIVQVEAPDAVRRVEAIVAAPEQEETVAAALRALAPLLGPPVPAHRPPPA